VSGSDPAWFCTVADVSRLSDIMSPATWKWALKLHHWEDGFPFLRPEDL
jgi:hypothetical protein